MTKQEFIEKLDQFNVDDSSYDTNGITNYAFVTFSKWKQNVNWEFFQSNMTLSGIRYAASVFNEDVFNKQHVKILFVDGNTNDLTEIVNTEVDYGERDRDRSSAEV